MWTTYSNTLSTYCPKLSCSTRWNKNRAVSISATRDLFMTASQPVGPDILYHLTKTYLACSTIPKQTGWKKTTTFQWQQIPGSGLRSPWKWLGSRLKQRPYTNFWGHGTGRRQSFLHWSCQTFIWWNRTETCRVQKFDVRIRLSSVQLLSFHYVSSQLRPKESQNSRFLWNEVSTEIILENWPRRKSRHLRRWLPVLDYLLRGQRKTYDMNWKLFSSHHHSKSLSCSKRGPSQYSYNEVLHRHEI